MQFSTELRNARADQIEVIAGLSPILKLRTGAKPTDCAAADAGTVVATLTLPSDWAANAANGVKSKSGTWEDLSADANGTIAHWRLYKSDGTTCVAQGTCSLSGGGGEMILNNTNVTAGQPITITSWATTEGNA